MSSYRHASSSLGDSVWDDYDRHRRDERSRRRPSCSPERRRPSSRSRSPEDRWDRHTLQSSSTYSPPPRRSLNASRKSPIPLASSSWECEPPRLRFDPRPQSSGHRPEYALSHGDSSRLVLRYSPPPDFTDQRFRNRDHPGDGWNRPNLARGGRSPSPKRRSEDPVGGLLSDSLEGFVNPIYAPRPMFESQVECYDRSRSPNREQLDSNLRRMRSCSTDVSRGRSLATQDSEKRTGWRQRSPAERMRSWDVIPRLCDTDSSRSSRSSPRHDRDRYEEYWSPEKREETFPRPGVSLSARNASFSPRDISLLGGGRATLTRDHSPRRDRSRRSYSPGQSHGGHHQPDLRRHTSDVSARRIARSRSRSPSPRPARQSTRADKGMSRSSTTNLQLEMIKSTIICQPARIREYIDDLSGILELPKTSRGEFPAAFFHADAVFVAEPKASAHAAPVRFTELHRRTSSPRSLRSYINYGSSVITNLVKIDGNKYFQYLAVCVWRKECQRPMNDLIVDLDRHQENLAQFMRRMEQRQPVFAAIHGFTANRLRASTASISQIVNDDFGLIEVNMPAHATRFFALFHKDDVYLRNGVRAVEYLGSRPLKEIVSVKQACSLSARSIITSKGTGMKPSVLELQAIVVSLNPLGLPLSSPRGSRLSGGPGTFGVSQSFSPYFFQENLEDILNRRLVEYLKITGRTIPDLDKACLAVKGETDPSLPRRLLNQMALVREVVSDNCVILESGEAGPNWQCMFTSLHVYQGEGSGQNIMECARPGMRVFVNADLVDADKPVQYLATMVWPENVSPRSHSNASNDKTTLQAYHDYNARLSVPSTPEISGKASAKLADYLEKAEGAVFDILDDNFALIQTEYTLALFDVCDFWVQPSKTADKLSKTMPEVVSIGTIVHYHAFLMQETGRIQYLATSVWLKDAPEFSDTTTQPKAVKMDGMHKAKQEIYETVVKSVAASLPPVQEMTPIRAKEMCLVKPGVVKIVFVDGAALVGGIIEFDTNQQRCFFLAEHCAKMKTKLSPNESVIVNAARVQNEHPWCKSIGFVSLSVYKFGDVEENNVAAKYKAGAAVKKLNEIFALSQSNNTQILDSLSKPIMPVVDLNTLTSPSSVPVGANEVSSRGHFHCLLSDESGLLEDDEREKYFVYFELKDVNVSSDISLIDLISILNKTPGLTVEYRATVVREHSGATHCVAHDKGVRVVGTLPKRVANICRLIDVAAADMVPVTRNKEKRQRFKDAQEKFDRRKYLTWSDLQQREMCHPENLRMQIGTVKFVLNENFGLIFGPESDKARKTFCLFDIHDLWTVDSRNAAEDGLEVSKVVSVGDDVFYNACLINGRSAVPYLATAVWTPGTNNNLIEFLPRDVLQSQKIEIYRQVVKACRSFLNEKASLSDGLN